MKNIEKAILKTLAFFDILERPLSFEEVHRFLYRQKASQLQMVIALEKLKERNLVYFSNNLYALPKSAQIIESFLSKALLNKKRLEKVKFFGKSFLKFVPFIKNISVINSLSFQVSKENSDIDILIITSKNKFWLSRAFAVLISELIGQNKNKWEQANKFCLGFGFDESSLALDKVRIKNEKKDIGFTYWFANILPIIDRGIYKKFVEANPWLYEELPNWEAPEPYLKINQKLTFCEKLLDKQIFKKLFEYLSKIQMGKINKEKESYGREASIIVNPNILKLHAKRMAYSKEWLKRLKSLKISD